MEFKLKEIALDSNLMRADETQNAIAAYEKMRRDLDKLKRLASPDLKDEEFLQILGEFYTWDKDTSKEFAQTISGATSKEQEFVLSAPAFSGKMFSEAEVPKQVFTWSSFKEYMKSNNVVLWDLDNFGTPEISTPKINIEPSEFTEVFHLLIGQMLPDKFADLKLYGDRALEGLKQVFTPEKRTQDIIHYVHMLRAVGKTVNIIVGANLDILISQAESLAWNGKDIEASLSELESSITRI